jgi:histone H3/H4
MEMLVVQSKVKDMIKDADMNTAGELPEALSKSVEDLLKKAVARAKANGRKTVRPEDL